MAIDHHPTKQELPYLVKYCHTASAALLIYNMYKNIYKFSKQEINLVVAASYIDTLSLKSTKTTPSDIVECKNLIAKYDLNKDEMYLDGLSITDMSDIKACSLNGLKKYEINNNKVYSSYVQVTEDELNKIPLILKEIPCIMRNKSVDYFVFIVTNVSNMTTKSYLLSKNFGSSIEVMEYNHIASRGQEIIPELERKLMRK